MDICVEWILSLAQDNFGLGASALNRRRCREAVQEAAARGSHLVLLPELWHDGLDYAQAGLLAEPLDAGPFAQMRALAREFHLYVAGSAFERGAGAVYNTLALFSPAGELVSSYRKIHLFRPMGEDKALRGGDALVTAELPWGKVGLAVCYDLRFPELFRAYALQGAVAVLLPAQWPRARWAHWHTLLRARAIENQLFIIACNRAGADGDTVFAGRSAIIDPWGEHIVEGGTESLLLTAAVNTDAVEHIRARLPVLADRRPDIYGEPTTHHHTSPRTQEIA